MAEGPAKRLRQERAAVDFAGEQRQGRIEIWTARVFLGLARDGSVKDGERRAQTFRARQVFRPAPAESHRAELSFMFHCENI